MKGFIAVYLYMYHQKRIKDPQWTPIPNICTTSLSSEWGKISTKLQQSGYPLAVTIACTVNRDKYITHYWLYGTQQLMLKGLDLPTSKRVQASNEWSTVANKLQ